MIRPIRGFAGAKGALHHITVTAVVIFLILQLTSQVLVFGRFPQNGNGQTDPMFFTEGERLPVPINFTRQNALRPVAIMKTLHRDARRALLLAVMPSYRRHEPDPGKNQ